MKEFLIAVAKENLVMGRNGDVPISIGDVFTRMVYYIPKKPPYEESSKIDKEQNIEIKVVKIYAYGRDLNELSGLTTGAILVTGETDKLRSDWVLLP